MQIQITQYGLSLMIAAPLLGALGLLLLKGRIWTIVMCIVGSGLALLSGLLLISSLRHVGGLELLHEFIWIPQWNVSFAVAVDGLSFYLILITIILIPIGLYLDDGPSAYRRRRLFFVLIYETALLGLYCALDIFLFLFCLELATLSLFFYLGHLAGDTTGEENRRFFILNLIGSGALFIAMLGIYTAGGGGSHFGYLLKHRLDAGQQTLYCGFFLLGIGIKGALVPWHSWFRDLESRMNPGTLIAVNGLFLPVAGYAIIRFGYTFFPDGFMALRDTFILMIFLSVLLSLIWGWGSKIKPGVVGYMSMTMAAWIFLGISSRSSEGSQGALYLMAQHAWIMGLVAVIVAMRSGHREGASPWMILLGVLCCLALMAFPGSGTFVAFLLIGSSAFHEYPLWIACSIAAWILLSGRIWLERASLFEGHAALRDRSPAAAWLLGVGLALLILWGGLHPNPVLDHIQRDSDAWLARFQADQGAREGYRP